MTATPQATPIATNTATPAAGLLAQAQRRPEAVALIHGDRSLTYAQLDDAARRGSFALHALGVRRGDRVAIMLRNCPEWFVAAHACGRLGATVVPINWHFKAYEAGWLVSDSQARVVVTVPELEPALVDCPDVPRLLVGSSWEQALAAAPADGELDPPEVIGDAWPASMSYTSGTTGRPKGVAIAGGDFRITAAGVAGAGDRWALDAQARHLLVGPAYHAGPGFWAQMHLAFGGTVVIMDRWDPLRWLALVEQHRITNSHMVPANFIRLLEVPASERSKYDLSSLTMIVHAAAPCPIPVKRALMDWVGADKVFEYYGASEGGGATITPQEWIEHPGSVGRAYPGTEFRAVDDDGRVLPTGEVGTIYVHLDAGGFDYHNDPEKTASSRRSIDGVDGWFTVGDIGHLDADGYLYITDRKSDMVISGGVNIYPREIEDCLYRHGAVADCVVFGAPDPEWGEQIVAVVQPRIGTAPRPEELIEWVRSQLADYKRPRILELVDKLPRDDNGKIRKPVFRREWLEARGLAPEHS